MYVLHFISRVFQHPKHPASYSLVPGCFFHPSTSDKPLDDGRRCAVDVDRHGGRTANGQCQRFRQMRVVDLWRLWFIVRIDITHRQRSTHRF